MPLYLTFYFWLLLISGIVFTLERLFPWRRQQEVLRDGFVQDLFWMVFNTQYLSWMLAVLTVYLLKWINAGFFHFGLSSPESLKVISNWPLWLQFAVFFPLKDFIEWNVHRWLHTVPLLWRLHRLHHSIEELDWATAFRSHWAEILLYKILVYLPLVILGVDDRVVFSMVVLALLIQELAHANLKWDFGLLRYVFTSPRYHAWHHDVELHGRGGQNFGISLALWDWLFGTAYWPAHAESPAQYGIPGLKNYPKGIWMRLWEPFFPARHEPASGGESAEKRSRLVGETQAAEEGK